MTKKTVTKKTVRAAIYCRISKDLDQKKEGVERQEEDCRALADRLGFEVVQVYVENDVSASGKSRKPRPLYAEMLKRARAGEFGAIVAYSNSRLTRRFREFIDLIELAERHGVRIVTVVSGEDNLATADGRQYARIKASIDTGEAERTSERVTRAKKQAAEEGKYRGGRRPYGFNTDGTHRKYEAETIRYATKAILAGRSLMGVAQELNTKKRKTSTGAKWSHNTLRDVLLRPRNAGLVATGRPDHYNVEIIAKAQWEPIVSKEEWEAVSGILLDPSRRRGPGNSPKWLGSGIYICAKPGCGATMRSYSLNRQGWDKALPGYRCNEQGNGNGHVTVMAEPTDELVREYVAAMVRDPRFVAAMTAGEGDAMQPDRERRALLMTRLEQTERDYIEHDMPAHVYKAKAAKINAELVEVEQRLAEAVQAATVSPIFSQVDPGQAFLDAPLDVQRAVLRSVLRVEVLPYTGKRGADRLRFLPIA